MTHLLALHGFTGCGNDFAPLQAYLPTVTWICPDLPGHERGRPTVQPVSLDAVDALLEGCTEGMPPLWVLGYSLGGRLALRFALNHPERVAGLVLIGTTPGFRDEHERAARLAADHATANRILNAPLPVFLEAWMDSPMIRSQKKLPPDWLEAMRTRRLQHDPQRLASAAIALGQGSFPPLWDALPRLNKTVTLITGESDKRYGAIAERMLALLPQGQAVHHRLPGAGHCAHLENPDALIASLPRAFRVG